MSKFYGSLKAKCDIAGVTLKEACERAGVPESRIYQWRYRPPEPLKDLYDEESKTCSECGLKTPPAVKTLRKLENAIDEIKEENQTDSASV